MHHVRTYIYRATMALLCLLTLTLSACLFTSPSDGDGSANDLDMGASAEDMPTPVDAEMGQTPPDAAPDLPDPPEEDMEVDMPNCTISEPRRAEICTTQNLQCGESAPVSGLAACPGATVTCGMCEGGDVCQQGRCVFETPMCDPTKQPSTCSGAAPQCDSLLTDPCMMPYDIARCGTPINCTSAICERSLCSTVTLGAGMTSDPSFGTSVAFKRLGQGSDARAFLFVGAPGENGGVVYVFERSADNRWLPHRSFAPTADQTNPVLRFGATLVASPNAVFVGAPQSGEVFAIKSNKNDPETPWELDATPIIPNNGKRPGFGAALEADAAPGDRVYIGSPLDNQVYVHTLNDGTILPLSFTQELKDIFTNAGQAQFGASIEFYRRSDRLFLLIGAPKGILESQMEMDSRAEGAIIALELDANDATSGLWRFFDVIEPPEGEVSSFGMAITSPLERTESSNMIENSERIFVASEVRGSDEGRVTHFKIPLDDERFGQSDVDILSPTGPMDVLDTIGRVGTWIYYADNTDNGQPSLYFNNWTNREEEFYFTPQAQFHLSPRFGASADALWSFNTDANPGVFAIGAPAPLNGERQPGSVYLFRIPTTASAN